MAIERNVSDSLQTMYKIIFATRIKYWISLVSY